MDYSHFQYILQQLFLCTMKSPIQESIEDPAMLQAYFTEE